MALSNTTQLEAVNTMLSVIGEAPVATVSPAPTQDVTIALNTLEEIQREVQTRGWSWNTAYDVELTPDGSNNITPPAGAVRFDNNYKTQVKTAKYSVRGGLLYDLTNKTDEFDGPITLTIITMLDWDDMTEAARRYIMIRAARVFQDRMSGSPNHHSFNFRDEAAAYAELMEAELEDCDYTIYDHPDTFDAINRSRPSNSVPGY